MSITCHWIDTNNQKTEFTVTLLKPLKECTITDFNNNAFAASYDQINNVAYVGSTPQRATENSKDTVWFNTSNRIDFSTLHFSSKSDTTLYRRTLVLAVPQYTEISSFTIDTLPDNVYLVSDIQAVRKTVLINAVQYRNDFLRAQLNFSTPLKHCLYGTVFDYEDAAELITDGDSYYKLIPVFLYVQNDQIFITRQEPYNPPVVNIMDNICGFADGIACFNNPEVKLCLGVNPNDRQSEVSLTIGYYNNIIDSVYGDMLNIYDYPSTINADIKLSIYSEQDNLHLLYLQRGVLLNKDCYTACASQYGFIFINALTDEIYEPAMRDSIVEGYKELITPPSEFKLLFTAVNPTSRTIPPIADVQVSNEQEYYTVGTSLTGRWQVRRCSINDTEHPIVVEDFGPVDAIKTAYLEADGDFDYFAGQDHLSLVTNGPPWLVVIRAADKHMSVKKVGADVSTAVLLDTDVEQASMCRGWKSDKYDVDSGLIVAYRKATGAYMRAYYKINGTYAWDAVQILSSAKVDNIEVKRLNDFRIGIYTYSKNELNQVWLSPRYYIGGTSKTEYVHINPHSWINVATAHMVSEPANQDFTFLSATIENNRFIRVHGKYPIYSIDRDVPNITLTDSYKYSTIVDYTIDNGDILIEMDKPKLNAYNLLTITFNTINHIKYIAGASRTGVVPSQSIEVVNKFVPDEFVKITATAIVSPIVAKQRQDFVGNAKEHVYINSTAVVGILNAQPIAYINTHVPEDTVVINAASAVSELTATQSGVTPV